MIFCFVPRFSRGSVQTILPPNKRLRTSGLCSSFDGHITDLERDALKEGEEAQQLKQKKRQAEEKFRGLQSSEQSVKVNASSFFNNIKYACNLKLGKRRVWKGGWRFKVIHGFNAVRNKH